MYKWFISLLALLVVFASPENTSGSQAYREHLRAEVVARKLYNHPQWMKLLYYRRDGFSGGFLSEATSPVFFSSISGDTDPESELLATVDAMFLPPDLGNQHIMCKFPARTGWLTDQLEIDRSQMPAPHCEELDQWRSDFSPTQVSVVLPTSYLNNPSSMFGHAFLKFESTFDKRTSGLLAYTVNFAADTRSFEGTFDYIYRGLTGGFPCNNSTMRYHRMLKKYAHIENRDIWEYKLKLSQPQIDRLVLHLWELRDENIFDYYFISKNCAYRLIAMLEGVKPEIDFTDALNVVTLPSQMIAKLRESGLIEETSYQSSALKVFLHNAEGLDQKEKHWIQKVVAEDTRLDDEQMTHLSPDRIPHVLAAASEYLNLLLEQDRLDRTATADLERNLLLKRLRVEKQPEFEEPPPPSVSPELGHKHGRLSVGVGANDERGFISVGYRALYHGLMDPLAGYDKGMQIELLDIDLRKSSGASVELNRLTLVDVASYSPISTFFTPLSWRYSLGREKKEFDFRRTVNYLDADWGGTISAGRLMLSPFLLLSLENARFFRNDVVLRTGLSFEALYQSPHFSTRWGLQFQRYLDNDLGSSRSILGEIGVPLSRNLVLHLTGSFSENHWKRSHESTICVRHFFLRQL